MVVRENPENILPLVRERAIAYNCSIFRAQGELGAAYAKAVKSSEPYAGVRYVETLVNPTTGQIEEILQPNPTRVYERETVNEAGKRVTVPVPLSKTNPNARLAVFVVDAQLSELVIEVIARDEILPEARECLRESVILAKQGFTGCRRAA